MLRLGVISKTSYSFPSYPTRTHPHTHISKTLGLHLPNQWQRQGVGIEADMEVQTQMAGLAQDLFPGNARGPPMHEHRSTRLN